MSAGAAGAQAGGAINADLVIEDTELTIKVLTPAYWEESYGSGRRPFTGEPNVQLAATASDLPPGTALDVGCGRARTRSGSPAVVQFIRHRDDVDFVGDLNRGRR